MERISQMPYTNMKKLDQDRAGHRKFTEEEISRWRNFAPPKGVKMIFDQSDAYLPWGATKDGKQGWGTCPATAVLQLQAQL